MTQVPGTTSVCRLGLHLNPKVRAYVLDVGAQPRTSPRDVARWLAVVFGTLTRGEDGMTNDVLGR